MCNGILFGMSPSHSTEKLTPRDLITSREAATLLGLSSKTVMRMAARGVLGFYELPVRGGLRFSRAELVAWLQAQYHPPLRRR